MSLGKKLNVEDGMRLEVVAKPPSLNRAARPAAPRAEAPNPTRTMVVVEMTSMSVR